MELKVQIHLNDQIQHDKEVVERLVETNLNSKVSGYLKKYEWKADATWTIDVKLEKNKKDLFNGKLIAELDRDEFVFEREDYDDLESLINNLFKHLKEKLSDM